MTTKAKSKGSPGYTRFRKAATEGLRSDAIPRRFLGLELQRRIRQLGLSRAEVAVIVDDADSQVSRLMNGHFGEFSQDRLVKWLTRLGSGVQVSVQHPWNPKSRARGRVVTESNWESVAE